MANSFPIVNEIHEHITMTATPEQREKANTRLVAYVTKHLQNTLVDDTAININNSGDSSATSDLRRQVSLQEFVGVVLQSALNDTSPTPIRTTPEVY